MNRLLRSKQIETVENSRIAKFEKKLWRVLGNCLYDVGEFLLRESMGAAQAMPRRLQCRLARNPPEKKSRNLAESLCRTVRSGQDIGKFHSPHDFLYFVTLYKTALSSELFWSPFSYTVSVFSS